MTQNQHTFRIVPLDTSEHEALFKASGPELIERGAILMTVDSKPGYPCRVSLQDADIGETVVLFPFSFHDVASPYQASGPVFIRKHAQRANVKPNDIPEYLLHRHLSLRAYDKHAMMVDGLTCKGHELVNKLNDLFDNEKVSYIQIHNAAYGCYLCQAQRTIT